MDDSSGKYNQGFFWGNNYWTGSLTQCSFIHRKSTPSKSINKTNKNTDFTYVNGNFLGASEMMHENPPFIPGFYMLKVLLNNTHTLGPVMIRLSFVYSYFILTFYLQPRTVLLGLCLPGSCQLSDVVEMTMKSEPSSRDIQIVGVRSPTLNNFSLWKDFTFQILL